MNKKNSILPIFLTVFVDLIGIGIAIPILAPMFLDQNSTLFDASVGLGERTFALGIILALYPIFQFFGAPILGGLSDRMGRKPLLSISIFGTMIGYVLFAIGISMGNIWLLIIGRIIDGFTGGNISIAQSAIADSSDLESKAKNFGLIGMAFGLGFIIGPFIGGKLGDSNVISWFNYSTPFWFAAILSLVNLILIQIMFKETIKEKVEKKADIFMGFRNVIKAIKMPNIRVAFLVVFLMMFGFTFFTQFFQVFLIERFDYTQSQIGDLFAFMGVCVAIVQGGITRIIAKRFKPTQVLKYALLGLSIVVGTYILVTDATQIYYIVPFIALFNGISQPNLTALISNLADEKSQGEILGINQSIIAIAWAIPPIISGFISAIDVRLPIVVGSTIMFLAWGVFIIYFRETQKQKFHEV